MKILIFALAMFGITTSSSAFDKTSSLDALKTLETKLETNLKGKLDENGVKQLKNLLELTAFSHLTGLAKKTPQELQKYKKDLKEFEKPQIDEKVYQTEIKKIDEQIRKQQLKKELTVETK